MDGSGERCAAHSSSLRQAVKADPALLKKKDNKDLRSAPCYCRRGSSGASLRSEYDPLTAIGGWDRHWHNLQGLVHDMSCTVFESSEDRAGLSLCLAGPNSETYCLGSASTLAARVIIFCAIPVRQTTAHSPQRSWAQVPLCAALSQAVVGDAGGGFVQGACLNRTNRYGSARCARSSSQSLHGAMHACGQSAAASPE